MKAEIGISRVLDAWNAEVDIEDYFVDGDGSLVIKYVLDEVSTVRIEPRWVADWFGARFVEWKYDGDGCLDGMTIEREGV